MILLFELISDYDVVKTKWDSGGHYLIAFSQQKCGPIGPIGIDPGPVHVGMPWRSVHRSLAMD